MNSLQRFVKKSVIVLILLLIIGGIVYIFTRPEEDLCFDGIKNNGEAGVDCGGFCDVECPENLNLPEEVNLLETNWVKIVKDGENTYDLIASVSNDNERWGLSKVKYRFLVYDANGKLMSDVSNSVYFMPRGITSGDDIKYIMENNIHFDDTPVSAEIKFSSYNWKEVETTRELRALNKDIVEISEKANGFDEEMNLYFARGTTKNTSKYAFAKVDIVAVIFDNNGDVLAVGKTDQLTISAGGGWGFLISWKDLDIDEGRISYIDYKAETNVFNPDNFFEED
ncbi:MAG: hypothetical protein PHI66_03370 [Candidatus Pacebacteria bacterium]|nr:hypothetical protein [Candidatus Paceibacterota bacterium]